jgi:PAS domain S-box-containing protein
VKLNLSQKSVLLVAIPLLFELLFLGILAYLNMQAEEEAVRAFSSAQVSNDSNKLIRDMFQIGSLTRHEISSRISSEDYKSTVASIRADLAELAKAVKDSPSESAVVDRCNDATEEAYELVERLRNSIGADGALALMNQPDSIKLRLRSCINRMVSNDLMLMAQKEKERAEQSHLAQAQFRKQIETLLIVGVIFNIGLTIFVALILSKRIVGRLNCLVDNSYRLASGLPLNPHLAGDDEIANLDLSFHNMANALAEAEQREKSLIENSLDVICSLDGNARFTDVNPACEQVLGHTRDELLGLNLRAILIDEDIDSFNHSISTATSGKSEMRFETRVKRKGGKFVHLDWSIRWVPFEKRFVCVGHDITERKEVERMKQEFMAMVSHDLRTPLATMSSFHEMLATGMFGDLTERGQHLLRVVERNENRMLTLINDLLDLEKSESGRLTLNCSSAELHDLLDQSVKSVSGLAARQEVHLSVTPTDLIVQADSNRVLQVLVNLLSNAIKFSPKNGSIRISTQSDNGIAHVYIADEGRGVPNHLKETIFERFQQVEIADAVDKGGSGLGLAICKAIVELHGGTIKVEDNTNGGSIFSFTLPLASDITPAATEANREINHDENRWRPR